MRLALTFQNVKNKVSGLGLGFGFKWRGEPRKLKNKYVIIYIFGKSMTAVAEAATGDAETCRLRGFLRRTLKGFSILRRANTRSTRCGGAPPSYHTKAVD